MAQTLLQFGLSASKGTLVRGSELPICQFYSSTATDTISGGSAVKIVAGAGSAVQPTQVGDVSGATDTAVYGVVVNNIVKGTHGVGDFVEVAVAGCEVIMEADGAISAGDQVSFASGVVATASSADAVLGIAQESAAASGDLLRVLITCAGSEHVASQFWKGDIT